jgi:hypothetical protein
MHEILDHKQELPSAVGIYPNDDDGARLVTILNGDNSIRAARQAIRQFPKLELSLRPVKTHHSVSSDIKSGLRGLYTLTPESQSLSDFWDMYWELFKELCEHPTKN